MNETLEVAIAKGNAWAEKTLRDTSFLGSIQRQIKNGFPSAELANVITILTKKFGAGYALEECFDQVVESKQRGINKQAIITYEIANSITSETKKFSQVKLTNKEKELVSGDNTTKRTLENFVEEYKKIDFEGFIKGEASVINYVVEHFNAIKNTAEKRIPQYTLKEDLFNNRIIQNAGNANDGNKEFVSTFKSKVNFSDYIGSQDKKDQIEKNVFGFIKRYDEWKKLAKNEKKVKEHIRLNVALQGPPGTGKSYFCKTLAGEINAPVYFVKGADFVKKYLGEGKDRLEDLYKQSASNGIGVIVIEEADAIGIDKDSEEAKNKRDLVNAWLTLLADGVPNGKVVTVINTNKLYQFDNAILDRFPVFNRLTFDPLDDEMKSKIISYHLGLYNHEPLSQNDLLKTSQAITGDSLRGLTDISYLASCNALKNNHDQILKADIFSAIEEYKRCNT